jgi:hypothetical protein
MKEYLTAQQARNNMLEAQGINGAYKKAETEEILAKILQAAHAGHASLTTNSADSIIASRLKTLGYGVKITSDQRDGDFMTITW